MGERVRENSDKGSQVGEGGSKKYHFCEEIIFALVLFDENVINSAVA